jgi:hypothetical protein
MFAFRKVPVKGLFFALLISAFSVFSCKTVPEENFAAHSEGISGEALAHIRGETAFLPRQAAWQKLAPGLEILEWRTREYAIHNIALKIDLANSALSIIAYPEGVGETGVFTAKKPQVFARESGAAVVINATPFELPSGALSKSRSLTGIFRVAGKELSAPVTRYAALGFMPDNSAFIVSSQTDSIPSDARLVAGGFFSILKEGSIIPMKATSLDARMAVGISRDKRTLFILCAAGTDALFPRGMSYEECALTLLALGAFDAMQFDGGSSTALVINGKTRAGQFGRTPANLIGFALKP